MSKGFRFILFLPIMLAYAANGFCQTFEISPFSGYTFPSSFDITGGTAKIEGNANFGISASYAPQDHIEWELSYTYLPTTARASSAYLQNDAVSKARLHFIMAGANKLIWVSQKVAFYPGVKVGFSSLIFSDGPSPNLTKFTFGMQGGVKYLFSDRVGAKLQGSLLLPIVSAGGSLWWNPNTGTNVSGWTPIVPFSINVGLVFRLN